MRAGELTWEEYRDRIRQSVVILPVGAMEQHGPHLPLNVDVVIPEGLAERVAERMGALVLPAITYGYKSQPSSGGGPLFPGTTSLNAATLIHLVLDILRQIYRHGARKFVLLNGHYENAMFLTEAADLFVEGAPQARVMLVNWWDLISDQMLQEVFSDVAFPGWELEHAAVVETSLVWHLAPDLVREERIVDGQVDVRRPYALFPPSPDLIPESGVLYKASFASPKKGERLVDHLVARIEEAIRAGLG